MGDNKNFLCFRNGEGTFEFLWINVHFNEATVTNEQTDNKRRIESKPWKDVETEHLFGADYESHRTEIESIIYDLKQIKETVAFYIAANERESIDERFPIQFFNLDMIETQRQNEIAKKNFELVHSALESQYTIEKMRIQNIKKFTWNCYDVKSLKLRDILTKNYVENFPLTHLDECMSNSVNFDELIKMSELINRICILQPWQRYNLFNDEPIQWPVIVNAKTNIGCKYTERFTAMASKVIDQQLSTKVKWHYDFIASMTFCHEHIDVDNECQVNVYNLKIYVSMFQK